MLRFARFVKSLTCRDDAQDLLEYGLLAALIALLAVGAVTTVGAQIDAVMWQAIATMV